MIKKLCVIVALLSFVLALGCASVKKTSNLNGMKLTTSGKSDVEHINVRNWGFYCLSWPVAVGSVEHPGLTSWLMDDTVNLDSVVGLLTQTAADDGASAVVDIGSSVGSTWIFPVFFIKSVAVSGNAVK